MAAPIEVLAGVVAGSGETARLLDRYRHALIAAQATGRQGATLWLTPSGRARNAVLERLCDGWMPVIFSPNVMTFHDFAERILCAGPKTVTPLSGSMQRTLLRTIVARLDERNELPHFANIAGTSGFLDLVAAFISELKRCESWPEKFTAACTRRGLREADRELAAIYREYQETLLNQNVYDSEGRFWSACETLKAGHRGPFANLSLVVADGFTDFTHTQHEILKLLAQRADHLLMSIAWETPIKRADLFANSKDMLEALRHAGDVSVTPTEPNAESDARAPDDVPRLFRLSEPVPGFQQSSPAIRHIARQLFANPRTTKRAKSAEGVEVVAVAGQQGEVNWLAARIKPMLLAGVKPDEIVIAIRDLGGYRDLIEEGFFAAGIPFVCDAGIPLDRIPLCRALVQVLQLEAEDWPFSRLLAVLNSSFFRPDWPEAANGQGARDVAEVLRRFKLDGGRERMLERLERAAFDQEGETPASSGPEDGRVNRAVIRSALRLLRRLSRATSGLRKPHGLNDWAGTLGGALSDLGFMEEAQREESEAIPTGPAARTVRDLIGSILFDAARAERCFGNDERPRGLPQFVKELTDLLQRESASGAVSEAGRVRILAAEQVRNLDIPHLFLAGLTERSFPRHQTDDCLYSESERRTLNDEGLSLAHRAQRAQEEMLMFYNVVTRARRRLVLSYPVVTADGEPLSPSPYLAALMDLFEAGALDTQLEEELDPVPAAERVLSVADARVRGMFDALANRPALLRTLCEQPGSVAAAGNLFAAVDMHVRRFETPGFTNYEGLLENPDNLAWVGRRYSSEHEFSATQLEAYAACPFEFFLSHVLDIEPLASVDVETEHGRRGTLVHEILAELHRQLFGEAGQRTAGPVAGDEIVGAFIDCFAKSWERGPRNPSCSRRCSKSKSNCSASGGRPTADNGRNTSPVMRRAGGSLVPSWFETAFGRKGAGAKGAGTESPGVREPLLIGSGERAVRIGGRIDRIDVGVVDGRPVFAIVDYKTGRTRSDTLEHIASGHALQLAIYTLAVVRLGLAGPESAPLGMGYWHIRDQGFTPGIRQRTKAECRPGELEAAVWESLVTTLDEIVPKLAAGMRAGKFPVQNVDPLCTGRCPYRTVCRVSQIRAVAETLGKTWSA